MRPSDRRSDLTDAGGAKPRDADPRGMRSRIDSAVERIRMNDPSLTSADLRQHRLGDGGAARVADALSANDALVSLDLGFNDLGPESAAALADVLEWDDSLRRIVLDGNRIGDGGVAVLCSALAGSRSAEVLSLRLNGIGDGGAASVAALLAGNESVRVIDLGGNDIGPGGAAEIASAVARSTTVRHLILDGNRLGDEGASSLAMALRKNCSVETINLNYNYVGKSGVSAFVETLRTNRSLKELRLGRSQAVGDEILDALTKILYDGSHPSVLHNCNHTLQKIGLVTARSAKQRDLHTLLKHNLLGPVKARRQKLERFWNDSPSVAYGMHSSRKLTPFLLKKIVEATEANTVYKFLSNMPHLLS